MTRRIINIGGCNADRMPFAGGVVYAMSKSALSGLVEARHVTSATAESRSTLFCRDLLPQK
jgi:NAD(P)-dependent dehydrogenase (short-subunit alcohol dehydrogenase family)